MTNGEKFKSAEERAQAYANYCRSHGIGCNKCPLRKVSSVRCPFEWLNLEYKKKLKPCPFCGSEASIINGKEDHWITCKNKDCTAALVTRSFSSEEEAIEAWNRRAQ